MDGLEGDAPVEVTDQLPVEAEATPVATPEVESFTDVDPNEVPDGGVTAEWLQERHKAMQGDYTRKTQEVAALRARQEELDFLDALRTDKDTQLAVLEELSQLLGDADEGGGEFEADEANPLETRLAQLENERAQQRASALSQEITSHIDHLAGEAGVELDDEDKRALFERATSGEIGKQQTTDAFKAWHTRQQALHDKWQKAYLQSKEASVQVPNGATAQDKPDLNDRDTRLRRFAAVLQGE